MLIFGENVFVSALLNPQVRRWSLTNRSKQYSSFQNMNCNYSLCRYSADILYYSEDCIFEYSTIRTLQYCPNCAETYSTYVCIFVQLCNKQYIKLSIFVSLYNKPLKKLKCDSIYFINRVLTVYIVHPVEAVVFHSLRSTKNKNKHFFIF